jgi:hypothetical protein
MVIIELHLWTIMSILNMLMMSFRSTMVPQRDYPFVDPQIYSIPTLLSENLAELRQQVDDLDENKDFCSIV